MIAARTPPGPSPFDRAPSGRGHRHREGADMVEKRNAKSTTPRALPVIRPRVAGIDIGSAQHWVCGPARADGAPNVRVFGTTTDQLNALADWLVEQDVESVAMESTSVYWIPVYEVL